MHLAELISLRTRPAAVLLLALTGRCPLHCAHCSTRSSMRSPEHDGTPFRTLVDSFTHDDHPEAVFMSGGEPLLRPRLVTELASASRRVGTRSCVLSGMFFARTGGVPRPVREAVASLDHFAASMDAYHEREVGREAVFGALRGILDWVPAVSVHVAGTGDDDPYVESLLADVRRAFGDRVPVLVGVVQASGRARTLAPVRGEPTAADPCEFATWPLVDYDGTVFACSRQSLARHHRPDHLVLGHAARDSWAALRARTATDPLLRTIRAVGAVETARRCAVSAGAGVCATCVRLPRPDGHAPGLPPDAAPDATPDPSPGLSPGMELLARHLVGRLRPRDLARRWGAGRHADLVELGWPGCPG